MELETSSVWVWDLVDLEIEEEDLADSEAITEVVLKATIGSIFDTSILLELVIF